MIQREGPILFYLVRNETYGEYKEVYWLLYSVDFFRRRENNYDYDYKGEGNRMSTEPLLREILARMDYRLATVEVTLEHLLKDNLITPVDYERLRSQLFNVWEAVPGDLAHYRKLVKRGS